jgi:hypothetical protein
MNFIGYLLKNVNKKFFMMRVLIIFMLLVIILPVDKPDVTAQEPDNPQTVYLPMVVKNSLTTCAEGPDQWLCLFNQYRVTAGLNPVTSNSSYNYGLGLHTNYLLKCPEQALVDMHKEIVCSGWTEEGRTAGRESNMVWNGGPNYSVKQSIDVWMRFASHRYNMLHPDISSSGFSLACDSKNCAGGLNVLGGLPASYNVSNKNVIYPVENQQGIPPVQFPITWAFYMPWNSSTSDSDEVRFKSAIIRDTNNNNVTFTVSESNHSNGVWDYKNQVILTPNNAFLPNKTYKVNMTVTFKGQDYIRDWSFTTASTP